ncbi:hypothetical protein [Sinosporangium siamense]|uniref:Uncharacterized protein n=1 Tax=Sinosporangium siamense TaxID=1367973 RepID=A0A919RLV2_9ACTN|nr:hypothetical protein [Sinosporangium siamense]GII95210.1 hypothetical protein Ssi02_54410 [Sinosporangium siamense]
MEQDGGAILAFLAGGGGVEDEGAPNVTAPAFSMARAPGSRVVIWWYFPAQGKMRCAPTMKVIVVK